MNFANGFGRRQRVWVLATLVATGFLAYNPALEIGFWTDDFSFLDLAGRLGLADYLAYYFDPRAQIAWYRPLQGLQWRAAFALLGGEARGYHLLQLFLHLVNAFWLFVFTARLTRQTRVAFIAALLYVTLPVISLAVFWPAVVDPLVAIFFLASLWFWLNYLERGARRDFVLAFAAFIAALMTKEVAATLPLALLLLDRLVVARPMAFGALVRRYAPFFLMLPIYLALEWNVLTRGLFTTQLGYGVNQFQLSTLTEYLTWLAFPFSLAPPLGALWIVALAAFLLYAFWRRERVALFFAAFALLTLLVVLPFPIARARYLYLPAMASAVGYALVFEKIFGAIKPARAARLIAVGLLMLVLLNNGAAVNELAVNFSGTAREARVQFRAIFQKHPAVEPGTLVYFFEPPFPTPDLNGLLFLRYGANATAYGTDRDHIIRWRDARAALIAYQDAEKIWQTIRVEKDAALRAQNALPARFGDALALDAFDYSASRVARGEPFALLLYWRARARVEKDYTVFVHLVDANGKMIASVDSPPRRGNLPTSAWRVDLPVADGIILPIPADAPPGNYRLEIGMYDLQTLQRLAIFDAHGQPIGDAIMIETVSIVQ